MADQSQGITPLAYSPTDFAAAVGLGRSTIFDAIKHGELATATPVVGGRKLKRKLITAEAGKAWLDSFPHGTITDQKESPTGDAGRQLELLEDKFTSKQKLDTDEDISTANHADIGGNHNVD